MEKKTKLNLGCGNDIKGGYLNVDIGEGKGVDIVWDLNKYPYPFEDNTFEEIVADMVLEHLNDKIKPMEEMIRICKNGAIIKITVPYYASKGALTHIDHKQFFSEGTFNLFYPKDYLPKDHWKKEGGGCTYNRVREKNVIIPLSVKKETFGRFRKYLPFKKYLAMFLINIYDHLYYEFKVLK
ncbi:MAG: methyltransferase domain-containing protein [Nanoarchaeota archaeon]|nr:methyltransferase domain-containing protein [Nanoarchaeota archaeon]